MHILLDINIQLVREWLFKASKMSRPRVRCLEPRNSLHFISVHFYFATVHAVRPCCDLNTSVYHRWNPSCRCSISIDWGVPECLPHMIDR